MRHELIQPDTQHYACAVCGQTWQTRPRSQCPGMTLYAQYKCGTLLTEIQLDYAGYHTNQGRLPLPVGCYQDYSRRFIPLYDPAQAVKKRSRRRQVNVCVSEVYWPRDCISLLETASYLRQNKASGSHHAMNEVAQMAFQFLSFSSSEIEQNGGGAIHLAIPPTLLKRSYITFSTQNLQRQRFARHIVRAYEREKTVS